MYVFHSLFYSFRVSISFRYLQRKKKNNLIHNVLWTILDIATVLEVVSAEAAVTVEDTRIDKQLLT